MVPVTESARCARIGRADYAAVGDVAARRTASARRERVTATTTIAAADAAPTRAPDSYDVRVAPSAMIAEVIRAILPRASATAVANATNAVSTDASRSHSTRESNPTSTDRSSRVLHIPRRLQVIGIDQPECQRRREQLRRRFFCPLAPTLRGEG